MCPSLIEIGSKTAEKNSAQTNKQTDKQTNRQTNRHYENNGHLAVNQYRTVLMLTSIIITLTDDTFIQPIYLTFAHAPVSL